MNTREPSLTPFFVGYAAKEIILPPDAIRAVGVKEVLSVSGCVSATIWAEPLRGPPAAAGMFLTEAEADAAITKRWGDFRVLCLGLVPVMFENGRSGTIEPKTEHGERPRLDLSEPRWYRRGYDPVVIGEGAGGLWFGCSPLSCNFLAETVGVNAHCLIEALPDAMRVAARFSYEQPEPGAYAVIEVWERSRPLGVA